MLIRVNIIFLDINNINNFLLLLDIMELEKLVSYKCLLV